MSAIYDWSAFHTTHGDLKSWDVEPPRALDRRPVLDHASEPHPILDQLLDEALTRILLVSDGAVMALKQRTTGSKPGTVAPTSVLSGIIDEIDSRYDRCKTNRARLHVVKEAQATADRLRYSPDRSKVRGTPEWRQAIARDSRSVRTLAAVYGVGKSTIARIKKESPTEPAATITQNGKQYSVKQREAINRKRVEDAAEKLACECPTACDP